MKLKSNPILYHGKNKNTDFFEGWYFKIVDKKAENAIAIIPGISLDSNNSHSFIQILTALKIDGEMKYNYEYLKFQKNYFKSNKDVFQINILNNSFSLYNMSLNLKMPSIHIDANLSFKNLLKWPNSILNPGSMGFFNYFSFLECYSHVCALEGTILGSCSIDNKTIDFTGGKVYIEKNWGKSFPKSWVWIQSNNFKNHRASVTCSYAKVPFLFTTFSGFLIGVTINNKFFKFATTNRSKIRHSYTQDGIEIIATKKPFKLTLKAKTYENLFVMCMGPKAGKMMPLVKETLDGDVYMKLEDTSQNKVIFEDYGIKTGVEFGGNFL